MKSSTGLSSRMSNYEYSAKKNTWKWTSGKIIAFSAFSIMIVGLILIESTPSGSNSNQTPTVSNQNLSTEVESTDFEKEYQEFLKQGKKIVDQETLDSLDASQTNTASTNPIPQPKRSNSQSPIAKNQSTQNNPSKTEKLAENNLQPIQLTPSASTNQQRQGSSLGGRLEEVNPDEDIISDISETSPSEENVITEEFYTEETISGTITTASDRTPIKGVTITVKGTNTSAISDANGQYTVTVPGDPLHRTIRFSFLGNTTEREVSPGTEILNIRF